MNTVVTVGVKLFKELGDRTTKLEATLGAYRQAMVDLAKNQGVEVPPFLTEESGSLGEAGSAEQLRQWLEEVLSGPARAEGSGQGGRGRGRGSSRGKKAGAGRSKSTREGKQRSDVMDEGE